MAVVRTGGGEGGRMGRVRGGGEGDRGRGGDDWGGIHSEKLKSKRATLGGFARTL